MHNLRGLSPPVFKVGGLKSPLFLRPCRASQCSCLVFANILLTKPRYPWTSVTTDAPLTKADIPDLVRGWQMTPVVKPVS